MPVAGELLRGHQPPPPPAVAGKPGGQVGRGCVPTFEFFTPSVSSPLSGRHSFIHSFTRIHPPAPVTWLAAMGSGQEAHEGGAEGLLCCPLGGASSAPLGRSHDRMSLRRFAELVEGPGYSTPCWSLIRCGLPWGGGVMGGRWLSPAESWRAIPSLTAWL